MKTERNARTDNRGPDDADNCDAAHRQLQTRDPAADGSRHNGRYQEGNNKPEKHCDNSQSDIGGRPVRAYHAGWIANQVAQLLFITGIKNGAFAWVALRNAVVVSISATHHDHITANARSLKLDYRATDCCDVTVHSTRDDHVATQRDRAILNGAVNFNRTSQTVGHCVADAFNDVGF